MPFASNAGTHIYYQVEGNGPPLLLHIGFMGRIEGWYEAGFVDTLRDHCQLILMDPRGQGRSDTPHDPDAYTLSNRLSDVTSVLDDLGIPSAHYLGYSMGGLIGFGMGVHAPDRLASLIIGGCTADAQFDWSDDEIALLGQGMLAFVDAWEREHGPAPPAARTHWLECDGVALAAILLAQRQFPDLADRLPYITLPTLLFAGTEDDVYAEMKQTANSMANADFVALDGLDHLTAFRQGAVPLVPHVQAFVERVQIAE